MGFKETKVKNGKIIINQGKVEHKMYIITKGKVDITLKADNKEVKVATLEKEDFFGEISLYNDIPRSATARASGDVMLIMIKNKEELSAFLKVNPEYSIKMVQALGGRLARTNELLVSKVKEEAHKELSGFMW